MTEDAKANASAPKAKKAKPPAPEDKPFTEFMEQEFVPALKTAFDDAGLTDMELAFEKKPLNLAGISATDDYWQVEGQWQQGERQFNLYCFDEDIKGQKGFTATTYGSKPSTLESFMIDERKITRDLMVMYTLQRINSEKWLGRN